MSTCLVHPPFTALRSVQTLLDADEIPISLGAQNVHPADSGAFTGEVSPLMLAKLNVRYVIVGHSERRELFGETDAFVNEKLLAVLKHGMVPILCVGETLAEREAGTTERKCDRQLETGFEGVSPEAAAGVVIAYEPIWAIGTGRTASPADAQESVQVDQVVAGGTLRALSWPDGSGSSTGAPSPRPTWPS